jgi:hypothetical protein
MPHTHWWGIFKVPFLFDGDLENQFRNAHFDLQRLKLWILLTGYTSMAYDISEWKIDRWLIKSPRPSLPLQQQPSAIDCQLGTQASLGSRQSVVQEVEHNTCVIQETSITRLTVHA